MSSTLFIALPLLFGFISPLFSKFGKNTTAIVSTTMQLFLFLLSLSLLVDAKPFVEVISINPPLGISFVLTKISLFFVTLFTFLMLMFSLYYMSYRKTNPYKNETKFFILINML